MPLRKSSSQRTALNALVLTALTLACAGAKADQFAVQFAPGIADHDVRKGDLGLVWDPGLFWWEIGGYHFSLVAETHIAYWDIRESQSAHPNTWEFGITPVFRFIKGSGSVRPYIEAGVGVRLLSHVRETGDRTMSSSFQFADMAGVGVQFGVHQNYQTGLRFQHLSNAGLKRPNPGINFSEIYLQYNF